jgi:hypothetical protein
MTFRLSFVVALTAILSCNYPSAQSNNEAKPATDTSISYSELLTQKEKAQQNKLSENVGHLILTVEFKLKATKEDLDIFKDGIVPWISLEETEKEVRRLIEPDKEVIPYNKVTLIIDYPLNNAAIFELIGNGHGFTRRQLILEISKKYHLIYKEEETSATTKTVPSEKREGLYNRNQTDGKYGVWGHDLSDLDLSSIDVIKGADGKIYLNLSVES